MSIIPYGAAILGGGALDPSTAALIAAMTTKPDSVHSNAINTFIVGLKNAGLWNTIDFMCGWGALNAAQSFRINWKNPAQIGTAQNNPVFAVDGGYTFDGATNYVDTGFSPSINGVALSVSSVLLGVYERAGSDSTTAAAGASANSTTNRFIIIPKTATGQMSAGLFTTRATGAVAVPSSIGLSMASLTGGVYTFYRNGSAVETFTGTPASVVPQTLFIGANNALGAASLFRPATEAGALVASGWSATQIATFYTLAQACMTAIGANV